MYEAIRKRRVKFVKWTTEANQKDQQLIRDFNKAQEHKEPAKREASPLVATCGRRDFYGWFAGYGLEIHETEHGVASYSCAIIETDENKVELIHVSNITFIP